MYCPSCGEGNEDNAFACVKCGAQLRVPPPAPGPMRQVPTYLVHSILVTLFCCLPFGIVAIVFAAQVNAKLAVGDFTGAVLASDYARKWCWAGFIPGFVIIAVVLLVQILMVIGVIGARGMQ